MLQTESSSHLLPIETLWHVMKKTLRAQPEKTVQGLRSRLQDIWDAFTPNDCESLVNTVSRRIEAIIIRKSDTTVSVEVDPASKFCLNKEFHLSYSPELKIKRISGYNISS